MRRSMLKLPPPIWAVIYLLLAGGLSAGANLLGLPAGPHSAPFGVALAIIGWIPPVWAIVLFRRERNEIQPTSPSNRAFITRGPYRLTRNPMYLGMVAVSLGLALWVGAWPMWLAPVLLFATVNFVHIPFEEAKMRRQYGRAFDLYASKVARWL